MIKVTTCQTRFEGRTAIASIYYAYKKYLLIAGNLFTWDRDNVLELPNGSLTDMPTWDTKEYENFCRDETLLLPFDTYSPDALPHHKAIAFCRALGGRMAMPTSQEDERVKWKGLFAIYSPRYSEVRRNFYLPVTDNAEDNKWVNEITGESPSYTSWGITEPNGGTAENCTVMEIWNPLYKEEDG